MISPEVGSPGDAAFSEDPARAPAHVSERRGVRRVPVPGPLTEGIRLPALRRSEPAGRGGPGAAVGVCGEQISLTAGTVLHKAAADDLVLGACLVVTHSNGISALQLKKKPLRTALPLAISGVTAPRPHRGCRDTGDSHRRARACARSPRLRSRVVAAARERC